jgi:hypothetical protein
MDPAPEPSSIKVYAGEDVERIGIAPSLSNQDDPDPAAALRRGQANLRIEAGVESNNYLIRNGTNALKKGWKISLIRCRYSIPYSGWKKHPNISTIDEKACQNYKENVRSDPLINKKSGNRRDGKSCFLFLFVGLSVALLSAYYFDSKVIAVQSGFINPIFLSNVVLSVDYNTYYLKYWKLIQVGWEGLLGVKLFLFVIVKEGQEVDLTEFSSLGDDYLKVVRIPEGASTMQASQWARVLGAGLVKAPRGGMNIVSDMDLLPASAKYFNAPLHRLRKETKEILMYYRHGILDPENELAIGYIAGHPGAWQSLTEVHNWNDFAQAMNNLPRDYSDRHGGKGWNRDQKIIWDWAHDPARNNGTTLAGFKDRDLGFKRYDVLKSQKDVASILHRIRRCEFTDIHMKAHDLGLPGPYWDVMTNVVESCNIRSKNYMNALVKADRLTVYGMSTRMSKPNLISMAN